MRYLSSIAGLVLLFYLLSLQKVEVFGLSCRVMSTNGSGFASEPTCMNDGIFGLGVILGLGMLIIGGILIAKDFMGEQLGSSSRSAYSGGSYRMTQSFYDEEPSPSYSAPRPADAAMTEKYDKKKWQVLTVVDPDIAAASAEVSALSPTLVDILAERYLVLNDRSYLPALVATIVKENAERIEAERVAKEKARAAMTDKQRVQMELRTARSIATVEGIKKAGMYNASNRKKAVSAEMYYGDRLEYHGYAKIVYEDGTAEMRSGDSWGACDPHIT